MNRSKSLRSVLPTKNTYKKLVKTSIKPNGYGYDNHFQYLLSEDSKFLYASTLVHGQRKQNEKLSVESFLNFRDCLIENNVSTCLLEMILTLDTVDFFTEQENQRKIAKFFIRLLCTTIFFFAAI
jgi:hypothetical protein